MAKVRADLLITVEQRDALQKLSAARKVSVATIIRMALNQVLGLKPPTPDTSEYQGLRSK